MTRGMLAAGVLLILTTTAANAQTAASGGDDPPVIVTEGMASLTVPPDEGFLSVSTEGRASRSVDAQQTSARAMTAVQGALKGLGIPSDAVRSTGYQLTPEYDAAGGVRTFRDYVARHTIEVRIDDLTHLADVLDGVGLAGAATVSGLRFDLKHRDVVEREALKRAVEDGLARADALASGARKTVTGIIRIQEQRTTSPNTIQYSMEGAAGVAADTKRIATPIVPGEIEIRAQVFLTVGIK
jgi:uncharacterized protein YggE